MKLRGDHPRYAWRHARRLGQAAVVAHVGEPSRVDALGRVGCQHTINNTHARRSELVHAPTLTAPAPPAPIAQEFRCVSEPVGNARRPAAHPGRFWLLTARRAIGRVRKNPRRMIARDSRFGADVPMGTEGPRQRRRPLPERRVARNHVLRSPILDNHQMAALRCAPIRARAFAVRMRHDIGPGKGRRRASTRCGGTANRAGKTGADAGGRHPRLGTGVHR